MEEEKKLIEMSDIAKMKCKELLKYSRQKETGETKIRKIKTMEDLVEIALIGNGISSIPIDNKIKDDIKETAIDIGNEFERREKEGKRKNRKATATAALSIALEKHLPWYQTLKEANIKAVAKRKEIMRGFDVINKK